MYKMNLCLLKAKMTGRGLNWQIEIEIYTAVYKADMNILYSAGNSELCNDLMGIEFLKEWYRYMYH